MSFVTSAIGVASVVGGKLIDNSLSGGGGVGGVAVPSNWTTGPTTFGSVNFKSAGSGNSTPTPAGELAAGDAGASVKSPAWILPTVIVGAVLAVAGVAFALFRRRK